MKETCSKYNLKVEGAAWGAGHRRPSSPVEIDIAALACAIGRAGCRFHGGRPRGRGTVTVVGVDSTHQVAGRSSRRRRSASPAAALCELLLYAESGSKAGLWTSVGQRPGKDVQIDRSPGLCRRPQPGAVPAKQIDAMARAAVRFAGGRTTKFGVERSLKPHTTKMGEPGAPAGGDREDVQREEGRRPGA